MISIFHCRFTIYCSVVFHQRAIVASLGTERTWGSKVSLPTCRQLRKDSQSNVPVQYKLQDVRKVLNLCDRHP